MANPNERNRVFVSYSHKDQRFLDDLLAHLKPLERAGLISAWSDKQILPGTVWVAEIKGALTSATIAVLLVTKDFLASDFVHQHELGPLLKEAEQGGVRILWIPVRACSYKETPLANYQALIPPDKPLAEMKAERDKAWVRICEEIKKATDTPVKAQTSQSFSGPRDGPENTTTISQITKQVKRLEIEWTLNQKNIPGLFERTSTILKTLHATVVDFYAEIAEGQSPTAILLVKSALDQILYLQNVPTGLNFDLEAFWNEGREVFDLLRRAQECLESRDVVRL
jgi:TIR domain